MNKNNIIGIIVIIIVAGFAMNYLSGSSTTNSSLSADVSTPDSVAAKNIYTLLEKMKTVDLRDSIFTDSTFTNLKEITITFNEQIPGRTNPFSPVGSDISGSQSSTTTTSRTIR